MITHAHTRGTAMFTFTVLSGPHAGTYSAHSLELLNALIEFAQS